jgi:FtsZ-binding cell division protein ZapB
MKVDGKDFTGGSLTLELEDIKCQREQLDKERKEIEEWKKKWQEYDQDFASHQREIWKGCI